MTWRKPESPSFPDWRAAWTRKPIPGPWTRRRRTIAVIGAGLNKLYPREKRNLAQRIADGHGSGSLRVPDGLAPFPHHFSHAQPHRERLELRYAGGGGVRTQRSLDHGPNGGRTGPRRFLHSPDWLTGILPTDAMPSSGTEPSWLPEPPIFSAGHELGRSGTGTASLLAMSPFRSLTPTASHFGRKGDSPRHQTGFQYY